MRDSAAAALSINLSKSQFTIQAFPSVLKGGFEYVVNI